MIDHQIGNNGGKIGITCTCTNMFICTTSHENLVLLSDKHNVCRKEKGKKELKDRRQTQNTSAITWCGIESNINPNIYTRTTFSIRFTDSKLLSFVLQWR